MVRFENVGLRYGLGPEILRDLSFQVPAHSFQFLTGPSGAGKTSLLRLLFLSLRPTQITVGMIEVEEKRRHIAKMMRDSSHRLAHFIADHAIPTLLRRVPAVLAL